MRVILAAVLTAVLGHAASPSAPAPYVLKMEPRGVPLGLLYTPETLAALVARKSPDVVPARIAHAIRNGDAIVVMWTIRLNQPTPSLSRRLYKIAVANYNPAISVWTAESPWNIPDRIEPKWIVQDAADLAQIDSRKEFSDVGAMAAFPREVFVPGRRVYLWLGPEQQPDTSYRAETRWATIVWNGNRPVAAPLVRAWERARRMTALASAVDAGLLAQRCQPGRHHRRGRPASRRSR